LVSILSFQAFPGNFLKINRLAEKKRCMQWVLSSFYRALSALVRRCVAQGQFNRDRGAAARFTVNGDSAAVAVDDLFGGEEPQAAALGHVLCLVGPSERLKQGGDFLRRDDDSTKNEMPLIVTG
jgi:hypothetical protein